MMVCVDSNSRTLTATFCFSVVLVRRTYREAGAGRRRFSERVTHQAIPPGNASIAQHLDVVESLIVCPQKDDTA